jgi:hypothetical protein
MPRLKIWACRDIGVAGDSLDKDKPHFHRMVRYFTKEKIPVRYWDGEKIVDMPKGEVKEILKKI